MKTLKFVLFAWLAAALPAFGFVERRVERTFEPAAKPVLKIDSSTGLISIRQVKGTDPIKLVLLKSADVETDAELERRLAVLDLKMTQQPDGAVSITARFTRALTWSWKTWPPVALDYELQVPENCELSIITNDAQVTIGAMAGNVSIKSDSGTIFTGEITGSLSARSSAGSISVTACNGPLDVFSETGPIAIGRANGKTKVGSEGGFIEVQRANGELSVRGNGSDAKVGFVAPVGHTADIVTSGGSVALQVPTDGSFDLDLRCSVFGKIDVRNLAKLDVKSGAPGKSAMQAKLNEGGPRISVKARGGGVQVRGMEPDDAPFDSAPAPTVTN